MQLTSVFKYFVVISSVFALQFAQAETKDQRIKVELRTISHEFLLQLYDTTSRILPIEKVDGRYEVRFEKEFSFEPDLLLFAVFKAYEENTILEDFIVEVEHCQTKAIVHSFKASSTREKSMAPCRMRELPPDCYVIYFTEVEDNIPLPITNATVTKAEDKPEDIPLLIYIVLISFVAIVLGSILRKKKTKETIETEEELPPNPIQSNHIIILGEFLFDKKRMTLTKGDNTTELSVKETDLLFLLYTNENKTLEREFILNQVWEDEGNYVGRTLDVFISKLRKKLESDSNIKITNVRGVGYRFVINKD